MKDIFAQTDVTKKDFGRWRLATSETADERPGLTVPAKQHDAAMILVLKLQGQSFRLKFTISREKNAIIKHVGSHEMQAIVC